MSPATMEIDGVLYTLNLAKIEDTMFGWEDHGILTAVLYLDFGVSAQGAGFFCLDTSTGAPNYERKGTALGLDHVMRIMRVVGVSKWEDVKGKRVYALRAGSWGSPIDGLANVDHPESSHLVFKTHVAEWQETAA